MRAPDGPKMAPKSAFFFILKIVRIYCKMQGPGGGPLNMFLSLFIFFSFISKNANFQNLAFYLDGSSILRGQGLFFGAFFGYFFGVFFATNF